MKSYFITPYFGYLSLGAIFLMSMISCKTENKMEDVDGENSEVVIEDAKPVDDWVQIGLSADDGHGPDVDSDEYYRSIVYRFLRKNSDQYGQEPALVIMNTDVTSDASIKTIDYIVRRQDNSFAKERIVLKEQMAKLDKEYTTNLGMEEVLINFVSKICDDQGKSDLQLNANSKMIDVVETSDQYMTLQYMIMSVMGVTDFMESEELWKQLISQESIGDWAASLQNF